MERIPNLKDVKKQLLDVVKEQINRVSELPDQVNTQYLIHQIYVCFQRVMQ